MSIVRDHRLLVLVALSLLIPASAAQGQRQTTKILSRPYQKWLDEDVRYLITDQERANFDMLATDRQRDRFVEDFWERRNPCPGSEENAFKEEHYRRLAYANEQFAAEVPGWKTDRGRIYVIYGPPDERERNLGRGNIDVPAGAPDKTQYPAEIWHYRFIDTVGRDVLFEFIDTCRCGKYELHNDPTQDWSPPEKEKDKGSPLKVVTIQPWGKWINEDVRGIITGKERAEFVELKTDQQRNDFVTAFWEKRNPTPGSPGNKFKEDHYQRIAYANLHFATDGNPGWKADRGRAYIMLGPPDRVLYNPYSSDPQNPQLLLPESEVWFYESINSVFYFIDLCQCGDYRMTWQERLFGLQRLGSQGHAIQRPYL